MLHCHLTATDTAETTGSTIAIKNIITVTTSTTAKANTNTTAGSHADEYVH